jgi:hypothetical protein
VFNLEDENVLSTCDLTFLKKTSPQIASTLRKISQDLEPEPGSTPQTQGTKDLSTTTCGYSCILAEDIVSDQD